MTERIESATTPKLGAFYIVPTVKHRDYGIVPIYGPLHEDREHLDFDEDHWHIDWRFARTSFFQAKLASRLNNPGHLHGLVVSEKYCSGGIIRRRMKFKRIPPEYPTSFPWQRSLQKAFRRARLPKCLTCPHRGISLKHAIPDANGVITCTGHGLRWNVQTRKLVTA